MTTTNRSTVVGVFPSVEKAELAIRALLQASFAKENISFFIHEKAQEGIEMQKDAAHYEHEVTKRTVTGTVAGTVLGGLLGTLTAVLLPGIGTLIGAGIFVAGSVATGALAGGFTGLMSTVGLSEEESRWFEGELAAGRPIVAVEGGGRYSEALSIMQIHGAYNMTREHEFTPTEKR